jgi:hypothetical protein
MRLLSKVGLVLAITVGALVARWIRYHLISKPSDPFLNVAPGAITLGAYAALLISAQLALWPYLRGKPKVQTILSRSGLLLTLIIALSLDLILNNYTEAVRSRPGWYGAVIAWDFITWIAWPAAMARSTGEDRSKLGNSVVALMVPSFTLIREALFMNRPVSFTDAGIDFVVLSALAGCWILLPDRPSHSKWARGGRLLLLAALLYWLLGIVLTIAARLFGFGKWVEPSDLGAWVAPIVSPLRAVPTNALLLLSALVIAAVYCRIRPEHCEWIAVSAET